MPVAVAVAVSDKVLDVWGWWWWCSCSARTPPELIKARTVLVNAKVVFILRDGRVGFFERRYNDLQGLGTRLRSRKVGAENENVKDGNEWIISELAEIV